jgi:hypothetical protein
MRAKKIICCINADAKGFFNTVHRGRKKSRETVELNAALTRNSLVESTKMALNRM